MDQLHRKILSLRYRGYDIEDIAHILDTNPDRVQRCIDRAAAHSADEERISVVREAELAKLEEMESALYEFAVQTSRDPETGEIMLSRETLAAQNQVLKLMERRAKIMGSDKQEERSSTSGLTLVQILADMGTSVKDITPRVKDITPRVKDITPRVNQIESTD